jgi:hypothetical protein
MMVVPWIVFFAFIGGLALLALFALVPERNTSDQVHDGE